MVRGAPVKGEALKQDFSDMRIKIVRARRLRDHSGGILLKRFKC